MCGGGRDAATEPFDAREANGSCGVDERRLLGDDRREKQVRGLAWVRSFALGQVISLLITGTGVFSTELADEGVQAPVIQSSLNYILLCFLLVRAAPLARRQGLGAPIWQYVLWAFCDVEGNFLVVSAYQYTSITSVMLLDCFAIPVVMALSCVVLGARYDLWHVAACCVCLVGLALTVASDVASGRALGSAPKGPAWLGDLMVIAGATLYGFSNVMQEKVLKASGRKCEALGMLGLCGTVLSGAQAAVLEARAFGSIAWRASTIMHLFGFQMCLFGMYVLTSVFILNADAAIFNLSMLTSDVYSVIFAWRFQHQRPTWMYGAAFTTTLSGLVLYYSKPLPSASPELDGIGA